MDGFVTAQKGSGFTPTTADDQTATRGDRVLGAYDAAVKVSKGSGKLSVVAAWPSLTWLSRETAP